MKKKGNVFLVSLSIISFLVLSSSAALAQESSILLTTNRFVVLDDPNAGTKAPGFFDPTDVRGGSWRTDYWNGESTTIRAAAQVLDGNGTPQSGITVTFILKNPGAAVKNTAQSTTDNKGLAYYSFNLNNQNYWGYWTIQANATVAGITIINATSFALNWWGCAQCHGNENPGKWGTYTPRSYYTMGYSYHKNQDRTWHTEPMQKGACIVCHQTYNGTPVNYHFTDNTNTFNPDNEYSPDWHKGKVKCQDCHAGSNISTTPQGKNPEIAGCYDTAGCHPRKNNNLTGINSTTGYVVGGSYKTNYSFIPNNTVKAHNVSSIPCITCHKAGHNITKPYNTTATSNTFTEYQQCTTCHQAYSQHNNNVSCTVCHSQDAHAIKVFAQNATYVYGKTNSARGDCTRCHQNSTFFNNLLAQPKAGSYIGRNPPQIPVPLHHSNNLSNGSVWGSYWTNPQGACIYCHNDTKHNSRPLGRILSWAPNYVLYGSIGTNASCGDCHYKGDSNYSQMNSTFISARLQVPPEITNGSWKGLAGYFNHSLTSYLDQDCKGCHGSLLSTGANMSEFLHNVAQGGGGPNCIGCHDIGGAVQHIINNTAMDTGIHVNINRNATNGTEISSENKKCWACHQSDGQQPTGMGDRFSNSYKCYDCHNGTAPYSNVSNAPVVSEHFKSGLDIKAQGSAPDNSSSCIACHNTSEMKVAYTGDNLGTNFSLPSHYGMKRTDLIGLTQTAYCLYCHNSSVENIIFGVNDFNNSIVNHSGRITTPRCADCHDTIKESLVRLHNSTLVKPVSNDTLCKTCHGPGGSAFTNNKAEHKNLYCTECHANGTVGALASKDIHGIKYLTQNNTFSIANTSAVNCVTCHLTTAIDSSLAGFSPFKISSSGALHHSNNPSNGTVWGNYWTPGTVTACIYCHNDTKHDTIPLGRPLQWLGSSYQLYGTIGTNSTCASCHYKGANNYSAMVGIFTSNGLRIPPEITNGSWNGLGGYFNHSLTTYLDRDCNICHGWLLSSGANMSGFLHNVASLPTSQNTGVSVYQNIGMYDTRLDQYNETLCRNCHNSTFMGGVPTRHHNPLSENQTNPTTGNVFGCTYCHPVVSSSSGTSVLIDRNCMDCHNGTQFWANSLGAAVSITRPHHINTSYDDTNIGIPATNRTCSTCHGSFVADYNDGHYIPSYNTTFSSTPYATAKAQNVTTGKLWGGCEACHQSNPRTSPPILSNFETHHGEILGFGVGHQSDSTPGAKCNWCHVTVPGGNPYFFGFNLVGSGVLSLGIEVRNSTFEQSDVAAGFIEPSTTNITFNGTACEKCHSVQSLHSVQFNYSGTNGLPGYGHIGNNSDCNGCHASYVAGAASLQGAVIPSVDSIVPSVLAAGKASKLTITGSNLKQDTYTTTVSVDGVSYTPTSITDAQLGVSIPALRAGSHTIQVVKGDSTSKLASLTAVSNPTITSAYIISGVLTITGAGFGTKPKNNAQQYVIITHGEKISYSQAIISWNNYQIRAKVDSTIARAGDTVTVITATGGEASAGIK